MPSSATPEPGRPRPARNRWEHRYRPDSLTRAGQLLREDRDALGLTQEEVAQHLGFAQAKLSAYERGAVKEPPTDRLIALARHYGQPPDRYLRELAWSRGARAALYDPEPGALVIAQPRAGVRDLVAAASGLSDRLLGELIDTARRLAQAEPAPGAPDAD